MQVPKKYYLFALEEFKKKNFKKTKSYLLKHIQNCSDFESLNLLGLCYLNLGEFKEAGQTFHSLIKKKIINDSILNNLAIALKNLNQFRNASFYFKQSIKFNKKNFLSHYNLGNLYSQTNKPKEAEKYFKSCLKIKNNYLPAIINLSSLYIKTYKLDKCLNFLKSNYLNFPNNKILLENISKIYLLKKNIKNAEKFLLKLIEIDPNFINHLIPLILECSYQGKFNYYKKLCEIYLKGKKKKSSIFQFNLKKKMLPEICFLSHDIRNHPIGFFLKDLLPELSKKFKIHIFNTCEFEDDISLDAKKYSKWFNVSSYNDEKIADLIYNNNIDILFDTSGLTRTNRIGILKLKPCNIQVSWAGWLASTNLKEVDYLVSDSFCTKLDDEKFFTEKIYRMKNIWCSYSLSVLKKLNLRKINNYENNVIFGCFQRPEKLNNKTLKLWAKMLLQVKNSKIIFINSSYNDYERILLNSLFKKLSVTENRIFFKIPVNRKDYLSSYNLVDVNLDTYPYNGGTTLFESSYMGVPTLTMKNNSFLLKCGESINKNLKMNDWIAKNENDFLDKAKGFSDKKHLHELKKKLAQESEQTSLFDSKLFSKNFEDMIMNIL